MKRSLEVLSVFSLALLLGYFFSNIQDYSSLLSDPITQTDPQQANKMLLALKATFGEEFDRQSIKPIGGGYSGNMPYTVQTNQYGKVVIKVDNNEEHFHRLSKIMIAASAAGIAPKVYATIPDEKIIISEFLIGAHASPKQLEAPKILKKVLENIRKMHNINASQLPYAKSYYERIFEYFENVTKKYTIPNEQFSLILSHAQKLTLLLKENNLVFSHNDLNPFNIFLCQDDIIRFIDWDDAGKNDPMLDLAKFANDMTLEEEKENSFLKDYFERNPNDQALFHFTVARALAYGRDLAWGYSELCKKRNESGEKIPTLEEVLHFTDYDHPRMIKAFFNQEFDFESAKGFEVYTSASLRSFNHQFAKVENLLNPKL